MSDLCLPRFVVEAQEVPSEEGTRFAWHPVAWFVDQEDAEDYQFAVNYITRVRAVEHMTVYIRPSKCNQELNGDAVLILLLRPGEEVS
jgi:hypothetical protein